MGALITKSDVGVIYRFYVVLEAKLSLFSLLSFHSKQCSISVSTAFPGAMTKCLTKAASGRKGVFWLPFWERIPSTMAG